MQDFKSTFSKYFFWIEALQNVELFIVRKVVFMENQKITLNIELELKIKSKRQSNL